MAARATTEQTPTTISKIATSSIPQVPSLSRLLFFLVLATCLPIATANCGVDFLYPQPDLTFYYLDTINVTYTSNFSNPTLIAFCGQASPTESELTGCRFRRIL